MQKINTKSYESIIESVVIDNREKTRREYAMKVYSPFSPTIEQLDIGDYVFKGYDGTEVVFEYKTSEDFLSSITGEDWHLHNQYYSMVTNYDYSFIIVEAEDLRQTLQSRYYTTGQDISLSQVNGSIADFTMNATILFVQTQYQAFDLMMRVAGKIIRNKPLCWKYGKKTTNSALNYLKSIKGVDDYAEIICRELDLHTHRDLMNLTAEQLTTVKGIGSVKAEKIIKQLK